MKKIYRIFILLDMCIGIPLQWSDGQSPTINLYRPATGNQLHEATQNITLSAGFSYDAQNLNTFNARVVPANGQAYNFTEPTVSTTPSINTAYPVGSIGGSWSVGPGGEANYTIPISIPPGIAGIAPNLSIRYCSSSREGLMGLGWGITGLSSITRVQSDLYHENTILSINDPAATSHFALDGVRLIPVGITSGLQNVQEYRTEIETFSRITAFGTTSNPTYFKVETKDGKIIEYGNTSDAKTAMAWSANKISDRNGNYMTVTYTQNSLGTVAPLTINYTGNASDSTFNTIQFDYQGRTDPIQTWIAGNGISLNYLISDIKIINEGTTVGKFQFTYNTTNSRLTQITEYGKNISSIGATVVNWGTADIGITSGSSVLIDAQITGRYEGDFNGDGIMDYVLVKNSKWYLYLANTSGSFTQQNSGSMPQSVQSVYLGDFNGDGKKDLLVTRTEYGQEYVTLLISTGNDFTVYENHSIIDINWPCFTLISPPSFVIGDFNGDGKDEFLAYNFYTNGSENYEIDGWDFGTSLTRKVLDDGKLDWGTKVYSSTGNMVLDVNGDGKSDLMVVDSNGSHFYELDSTKTLKKLWDSPDYLTINRHFLFGDFNGDGLTDIVTYGNNTGGWNIFISTGNFKGFGDASGINSFAGFPTDTTINNFYA